MDEASRIALTTGALLIPPTYFAVQHAQLLRDRYDIEAFARVAWVNDPDVTVPVHDATPFPDLPYPARARLAIAAGGRMTRQLRRFAPALVHQHFGTWSGPARGIARDGVPLVVTLHGYDVAAALSGSRSPVPAWHARNTRASYAAADRLLPVSRFLADQAIASGADPARIIVHYQGIDTDFFTPADGVRGADETPLVLFIGALAPRKGPQDLIAASRALDLPHRVVLVGTGPAEDYLRRQAAGAPHIEFAGSLPRDRVRELLRQARMLVLPTQQDGAWREAAGLVLLEAQACGAPVVLYESGGAPEMVDAGTTGLVVPERDVPALGDAIRSLLELDDAAYRAMSAAARDFVVRERSLTTSAEQLDGHYRDLGAA
jgi:glycosyltransferase involved in cell wall biosynthesis